MCDQLISSQLTDQAQTLLDHLITGNVPKTVSSPALNYLTEEINKIKDNDALDTFCRYGIEKLKQFPNAFDKADANLKYCLSDLYIVEGTCFFFESKTAFELLSFLSWTLKKDSAPQHGY